jgi:hypothetical protein
LSHVLFANLPRFSALSSTLCSDQIHACHDDDYPVLVLSSALPLYKVEIQS